MAKKEEVKGRIRKIAVVLEKAYPDARTELQFSKPLELLVATILSAQCTDRRVNEVTKTLFKKYRKPQDYLKVPMSELEEDIRPTGFFRNKTKAIRNCCQGLIDKFKGKVPDTVEELTKLPGIGRKTANMIIAGAFKKPGFPVDTHVRRVVQRLELSRSDDPEQIEEELTRLLPPRQWSQFSHALILLGRYVCTARNPKHDECPLRSLCPYRKE